MLARGTPKPGESVNGVPAGRHASHRPVHMKRQVPARLRHPVQKRHEMMADQPLNGRTRRAPELHCGHTAATMQQPGQKIGRSLCRDVVLFREPGVSTRDEQVTNGWTPQVCTVACCLPLKVAGIIAPIAQPHKPITTTPNVVIHPPHPVVLVGGRTDHRKHERYVQSIGTQAPSRHPFLDLKILRIPTVASREIAH